MSNAPTFKTAKDAFDRDGFTVLRDFLPPDTRRELMNRIDRFIKQVAPTLDEMSVFYEDKSRPETMMRIEAMNRHDPYFDSLMQRGPMRELAESFLDGPVNPQGVAIFGKAPRIGPSTPCPASRAGRS